MAMLIYLCVLCHVISQVTGGKGAGCRPDEVVTMDNIDIDRAMGTWYEYSWIPVIYEADLPWIWDNYFEIWTHTHSPTEDKIEYTGFGTDKTTDECDYYSTVRYMDSHSRWYRLQTFPINGTQTPEMKVNHWVLTTDYDNYLVAYGCTVASPDGVCQDAHAWLWTREQQPYLQPFWTTISEALNRVCITLDDLVSTPQWKDCGAPIPTIAGSSQLMQSWLVTLGVLGLLCL